MTDHVIPEHAESGIAQVPDRVVPRHIGCGIAVNQDNSPAVDVAPQLVMRDAYREFHETPRQLLPGLRCQVRLADLKHLNLPPSSPGRTPPPSTSLRLASPVKSNNVVQPRTHKTDPDRTAHRCRYGRPFRLLCRPPSVAISTVIEERTLRPNRVEELRPMSHPTAGCAAITLEAQSWRSFAHGCRYGRDSCRPFVTEFHATTARPNAPTAANRPMNAMGKPQKIMDRSASPACPMTMSNTYHLIDTTPTTAKTAAPTEAVNPINHRTLRAYAPQLCASRP